VLPGILSLLGIGTGVAAVVARWMSPALMLLALLFLARSFYTLYVHKRGSRASKILTWVSAAVVATFWTWRLLTMPF
jgi:hypothetical protein